MTTATTDAELVAGHLAGDPAALAGIYDRYADSLHDTAAAMLNDRHEAADVLQDVVVIAAERLGQLRDPARLKPWLFAILRNEVYRRSKRRRRTIATDFSGAPEGSEMADERAEVEASVADDLAGEELASLVRHAARGLDERDQLVLELSVRQGLEGQDLADALGVSANQSYTLVHRMRERIERSLGAFVVARAGRRDCASLDELLGAWDGEFTVLIRKRVARHIDRCEVCGDARRRVAPLALFGAAPVLAAPPDLRDTILGRASGPTGVHPTPYEFTADGGFPRVARAARRVAGWVAPAAAASLVLVAATVGVWLLNRDDDGDAAEVLREVSTTTTTTTTTTAATTVTTVDATSPSTGPSSTAAGPPPSTAVPGVGFERDGFGSATTSTVADAPDLESAPIGTAPATTSPPPTPAPPTPTPTVAPAPAPTVPPATAPAPTTPPVTVAPPTAPPATAPPATTPPTTAAPPPPPPTTPPPAPGTIQLSGGVIDLGSGQGSGAVSVTNVGDLPVDFSVTGDPAPFGVSPTSGTLAAGESRQIVASIDRGPLPEGSVAASLQVAGGGASFGLELRASVERPPTFGSGSPSSGCFVGSSSYVLTVAIAKEIFDESSVSSATFAISGGPAGQSGSTAMSPPSSVGGWTGTIQVTAASRSDLVGTWSWSVSASDSRGNSASTGGSFTVTC